MDEDIKRKREIMKKMIFAKRLNSFDRDEITFDEAKTIFLISRGILLEMFDLAEQFGNITKKEKEIFYFRLVKNNTLEAIGNQYKVTRERITQIEAKVEEKMRLLTQIVK